MVKRIEKKVKAAVMAAFFLMLLWVLNMTGFAEYQIQDDARLFSDRETQQIEELAEQIWQQYEMNVFVMTCDDAQGKESREVLEDTYEEYGLESNDARGGIALIIDMDNRELNLVTERDMMYYITDSREESIYDAAQQYASDGAYGQAMLAMLKETQKDLRAGIPGNQYTYDTETGEIVRYRSITVQDLALALIAALVLAGLVSFCLYRSYTVVKKYHYSTQQNASLKITQQNDRLVNQFVTHRKIERDPPPSGGDDGRTSTHQSSGGNTYGGGSGRGF